jgi:hypothetical protein
MRKTCDKIQYPFMRKVLNKLGIEESSLNVNRAIYTNPIVNIILNVEN